MRNLVLFTSMILSFWGCSSDKDFGGFGERHPTTTWFALIYSAGMKNHSK